MTGQNRSTQRRLPADQTSADPDAGLRQWLRDYAKAHPRCDIYPAINSRRRGYGEHLHSASEASPTVDRFAGGGANAVRAGHAWTVSLVTTELVKPFVAVTRTWISCPGVN